MPLAQNLCASLQPFCHRITIAGSLRRNREQVSDIEILYIPRIGQRPAKDDLFATPTATNLVNAELEDWLKAGLIKRRLKENGQTIWGNHIKLAVHVASKVPVDFFAATEDNWFSLLVCRTGSRLHNEKICNAAIKLGLQWDPYEGIKDRKNGKLLFVPRSEHDLFKRLNVPYVTPPNREVMA